jgi:hypothetical protein
MKSKTPKHLIQAHRLICGHDKLQKTSHSKAEYRHLNDVRRIFEDRNIVGLGIAEKMTEKKRTGELTLCFYVKEKKARRRLGSHKMVPPVISIDGVPMFTDVYRIGVLKAQINSQKDPIQSGFSVGNERNLRAGTVGAIVKCGDSFHILSNSHVLAPRGVATAGATIRTTYPAFEDGNGMRRVGTLRDIVPLKARGNKVDAALAEVDEEFVADVETKILNAASPRATGDPEVGMIIVGTGRTSGPMRGVVRDTNFSGSVSVPGLGTIDFVEQVICDNYSQGGDSGALIIGKESGLVVGLHVAGSEDGSMFTPIKAVKRELKFDFV